MSRTATENIRAWVVAEKYPTGEATSLYLKWFDQRPEGTGSCTLHWFKEVLLEMGYTIADSQLLTHD